MPTMKSSSKTSAYKALKYVTILGININSTPKWQLLDAVKNNLEKKIQFYIVTPNPEIVIQAQSDPDLTHSLNSATFSLPDGIGLKFADKSLEIIKGRQFMLDLFALANTKKLKVYLLGSTKEVINKSLEKIEKEYPNINAKGNNGPILNNSAEPETEVYINLQFEIVKEINSFKPDLLFVALGAPKQEKWVAKWLPELKVTGAMVIGGSLDYYSGLVSPVPNRSEERRVGKE